MDYTNHLKDLHIPTRPIWGGQPVVVRLDDWVSDEIPPRDRLLLSLYVHYRAEREATDRDDLERMFTQTYATAPNVNTLNIRYENGGWSYRWASWDGFDWSSPSPDLESFLDRVEHIDGPEHAHHWSEYRKPHNGIGTLTDITERSAP